MGIKRDDQFSFHGKFETYLSIGKLCTVSVCHIIIRAVASSIMGGGGGGGGGELILIYLCSAQLVSFESDCFYGVQTGIYEYQPPNYRACYGLIIT